MRPIKIDRYESVLVGGLIKYYAVAGKKKYPMPEYYKDMYDDRHLAIQEVKMDMPELFGVEKTHYIPLLSR